MPKQQADRLSHERILRAARDVVDEEGLDGLSMRRLAQELDVWPMSVYRYFRDKDELLDALAASAAGDLKLLDVGAPWREQVHELMRQARAAMGGDIGRRLPRAFLTPGVLRLSEAGLTILHAAGFSREDAARGWRALWSYTFGFSTFVVAPSADEARRHTLSAITALPDDEYPALTAAAEEFAAAYASEAEFEIGLERLLDGLEASSAKS